MDWKLFWIFVIIGVVIYVLWMFYTQREVAYLSLLLYREGNAEAYLEELDRWQTKLLFNKKLRTLMEIDARIALQDKKRLKELFEQVEGMNLSSGDRLMVLQKEIPFYLEEENPEKVTEIYEQMQDIYNKIDEKHKDRYTQLLKETEYMYAIHVKKDGSFAKELYQKAKSLTDDIPSGVYFYKASQSYYLDHDLEACKEALGQAETRLRKTPYGQAMKKMLDEDDFSDILKIRI